MHGYPNFDSRPILVILNSCDTNLNSIAIQSGLWVSFFAQTHALSCSLLLYLFGNAVPRSVTGGGIGQCNRLSQPCSCICLFGALRIYSLLTYFASSIV